MSDVGTTSLSDYVSEWAPGPVTDVDPMSPDRANQLAATLDYTETFSAGDELPVPWHWIHFPEWPATSALGDDGHPADGHFLPPIPHRRRMFAGSSMTVHAPLRLGIPAQKRSSLIEVVEKHGRTGDMLFVTVRSEYLQDGSPTIVEEQNLVYRSDSGSSRPFAHTAAGLASSTAPWSTTPTTSAPLLFRYSALTANSHRIHYDQPYVTGVEGYPDLVVHGPLLATYMADLARLTSGRPLRTFDFRLKRPVFLGDEFRVEGIPADDGTVALQVVSGTDTVHASGTGQLA